MREFKVTGMSCAACSARVEKAVANVDGVTSCAVNLLTGGMQVEGGKDADIIRAVKAAGYGVRDVPQTGEKEEKNEESAALLQRLIASFCFLLPLMYVSMGHTMWHWRLPHFLETAPLRTALLQMLLAAVIMIINGKFFTGGARAVLHGAPNMDTLVSLGAGAAFLYSTARLFVFAGVPADHTVLHGLYFESAGMILTLITVGKLLESRAKGRTTKELSALMDLAPVSATVLRDGKEIRVSPAEMRIGDLFVVRAGESVPADGTVIEGEGAADESMLTGESIPVDKAPENTVSAGTILRSGWIKCRAARVGGDTALDRIIKMVRDAAGSKAPIARIADRVSAVFVPAVMAVAAVTFGVWMLCGASFSFALARGISVLVISCPCALGLATPVAIMVGSGVGAKNGILFKTAEILESSGKVDIAVFDKTGTVTTGHPGVTDILPREVTEQELLRLAAALEIKSEHPLARAVVEAAETPDVQADDFKTFPGGGVSGTLDGEILAGGNLTFIRRFCGIDEKTEQTALALASEGKTPLYFARGDALIGLIAVADTLKEDSAAAFATLRDEGIRTVLLTGDHHAAAETIGRKIGADEVISEVLPEQKAAVIERLKQNGTVAMVGDGINDAPALAAADVGIAVASGTDVAVDTADVVLMRGTLSDVPRAVTLSRKTLRNIRQNLFWAFFYNVCGIPLAAGAFTAWLGWTMDPMFGAAAMSLSSFFVVTNALRLNFADLDTIKKTAHAVRQKNRKEETVMKKTVKIEGMMCLHCEANVKAALEGLDGVQSAVVSHEDGTAELTLAKNVPDVEIRSVVEEKGYDVTGIETK